MQQHKWPRKEDLKSTKDAVRFFEQARSLQGCEIFGLGSDFDGRRHASASHGESKFAK